MESKIRAALGLMKMLGVQTQPLEKILDQMEGKAGSSPVPATPGVQPVIADGPFWDGEPEHYFLCDKDGKRLTQETFVNVSDFEEGLAVIERQKDKGSKNGYINTQGQFPFEPKYEMAQIFSGGLGAVQLDKKWGFVDKTGKEVIPFLYGRATRFDRGEKSLAQVEKDGKWFFIDKSGAVVKESEKPKGF